MLRTLTREFFIPANAIKIADKNSDAIAYAYTDAAGRPCARVFYGKQSKPVVRCYYRNEAERAKNVEAAFKSRAEVTARKAGYKAELKASAPKFAVGDVLSTCWGYEQTNREFYEVVRVKGKAVTVRQIATDSFATGSMSNQVIPLPGKFIGEELRRMAGGYGLRITSCARATPHDFEMVAGVKVYRAVHTSSWH